MAGVRFSATTGEVVTGTSAKTLLQLVAATNQRILVHEWSISFIGTSNTAQPIKVDLLTQSDAGTMSALTLVKMNVGDDETLQSTAQHTSTSEPSTTSVFLTEEVHPQTGYTWQAPYGMAIGIKGGGRVGFRVTANASTSGVTRALCEE